MSGLIPESNLLQTTIEWINGRRIDNTAEQSSSERRRKDPAPQDRNKTTSNALSTGNINYSLKELIATNKSIRKQWSRNLEEAVTKWPLPRNDKCFLKEKMAVYDEIGQINMTSTRNRAKEETSSVQGSKSKKRFASKPAPKNNKGKSSSRLAKIDKALTFNSTAKQTSPYTTKSNQSVDERDFTMFVTDAIMGWLEKLRTNITPDAKNKIIEELTRDIVDRRKYILVFGSVEPSPSDDLEYLKLQVHRRLNPFVPAETLKAVIVDTKELLTNINSLKLKVTPLSANDPKLQKTGEEQGIAEMQVTPRSANDPKFQKPGEEQGITDMQVTPRSTNDPKFQKTGEEQGIADMQVTPRSANDPKFQKMGEEQGIANMQVTPRSANDPKFRKTGEEKGIADMQVTPLSANDPKYKKTGKEQGITDIQVTPPSANDPKYQKTGKEQGIADILGLKTRATNTSIEDEEEMEQELSNMEFSPVQTSTPGKQNADPAAEEYKAKVAKSTKTWLESLPINLDPEAKTKLINEITYDIVDRNKYLQVQPGKTTSRKEEIENLRFQVFKRLNKVDPNASVTLDIEKIEELYKIIGDDPRSSLTPKQAEEFRTALNEEISAILDDYNICCDRRDLHPSIVNELTKLATNRANQDEIVENLIESIKRFTYLSPCVCDEEAEELAHKLLYRTKKLIARIQEKDRQNSAGAPVKKKDFKEAMIKDIGDVFNGRPMSKQKRKLMESQLAEEYAKGLGITLEESASTVNSTGPESKKGRYGMSFNGLLNFIDTWLNSIHTDDETKGEEEIKDMKKDMAYSLIHKIGEMNVDPEIFNDDSLYETVLRDELQNLLGDISISNTESEALKEDLIEKVLEAQRRAHDEIAGQAYKRKLRDTISKLLPDQLNLSEEEHATIETLKDQLADAYIDLHYSGGNENQRERLKRKISDEINNFCRDYLYRNPCSPLNSRILNNNLYTVLNKITLPPDDSMRYEVEQARIRHEINDWIQELPLQPQNPTDVLARNKLVYVLSKKLFDIEVEGDDTHNALMKNEIVKFLNKIPLESGVNNDTLADNLIDKLKASEESRKYDASSNVTIDAFGNVTAASSSGSGMDAPICPFYKPLATSGSSGFSGPPKVFKQTYPKQSKPFPPCTLSPEDRDHLERIKRRTCLSPNCLSSFMRNNKRDTGVGPRAVDTGSQTVLRPFGMEKPQSPICPVDNEKSPRPCPGPSANMIHPPYSYPRRDPFEIEKQPPSPICPAAHEKTPRPCPAGPSRPLSLRSGQQMRRHTISSSNIAGEVQPQIVIKQYYWNPNEKNCIDEADLQQSGRSSRRQSDQAPWRPPGPAPCHQTGSAPFDKTRTPCQRPSLGKVQQQNCSPQRMTCDQSFTSPQTTSQHQTSPERYSYWDPQRSFQRPSQRDIPSSRSICTPSPCLSPLGLLQQSSTLGSPDFSKRKHECRRSKRNGLQDQMPCSSRHCRKERVIELGSLHDVPNARPKKRHSDQSDWPYTKYQEDDNFWGLPMRHVILDEGIDESVVMEREQREERIRCRCKERLIPKSGRSQPRTCLSQEIAQGNEDEQNLKRCSKCCGRHCPYPSFLYFKN